MIQNKIIPNTKNATAIFNLPIFITKKCQIINYIYDLTLQGLSKSISQQYDQNGYKSSLLILINQYDMYWIIDGICFCIGITYFILSFAYSLPFTCWVGIIWIIIYPLLLEGIYNIIGYCSKKVEYPVKPLSKIVYSPSYNITFCGIEKCHPFDSQKYGNIYRILKQKNLIDEKEIIVPGLVPRSLLLQKISKIYLLKLCYTPFICSYIEMPLLFLPGFLLRWRVLDPMLKASQGSILSICIAMKIGWSINLSGGFHHASFTTGGGFCIYPDISLAVHYLRTRMMVKRVMIIDLDAHQGNGHQRDHLYDDQTFIADFYNHQIYPGDNYAKKAISRDIDVVSSTTDKDYLQLMKILQTDIESFQPQFVIYNAGTDILQGDALGRLNITAQGIIKRDEYIFRMCIQRKIPVSMFLSGGYQKINAEVIADSIENLMQHF